jgi:hypothetical protein
MRYLWIMLLVTSCLVLSSCCHPIFEGGCNLKYSAPPGAHYIKPGMTREERIRDFASCSAYSGQGVFPDRPLQNYVIDPKETMRKDPLGSLSLKLLYSCMISKGYHTVQDSCSGNDAKVMEPCMYP